MLLSYCSKQSPDAVTYYDRSWLLISDMTLCSWAATLKGSFSVNQRLTNYNSQAKSANPVFINKVLLDYNNADSFTYCLCLQKQSWVLQQRQYVVQHIKNIYHLALYRRSLPTLLKAIDQGSGSFNHGSTKMESFTSSHSKRQLPL